MPENDGNRTEPKKRLKNREIYYRMYGVERWVKA